MEEGGGGDDWLGEDKALHVCACFLITFFSALFFSVVLKKKISPRMRTPLACVVGLAAGAAKEAADATSLLWASSGASLKDGVADILGVFVAASLLIWLDCLRRCLDPTPRLRLPVSLPCRRNEVGELYLPDGVADILGLSHFAASLLRLIGRLGCCFDNMPQ